MQVLDPDLDLRSVKYSVWRSGGDMKLFHREKEKGEGEEEVVTEDVSPNMEEETAEQEELPTRTDHTPPNDTKEE